jgi:DNA-binding CsgD family transcriptional regulator
MLANMTGTETSDATSQADASAICWSQMPELIEDVRLTGQRIGLPFIAVQSDVGDPQPMSDQQGRPYAETTFEWVDPDYHYWKDRKLALQAPLLTASRLISEPFYYANRTLKTWRPTSVLDGIDCSTLNDSPNFSAAIGAPVHLPRGLVGLVLWAAREPVPVEAIFAEHAEHLSALALRLVATHIEARRRPRNNAVLQSLTRREVQCLRWAAAGKTDGEIGIILSLSVSTVRFHLRNAAGKLGATGRAQAIQLAAGLGYVGARLA